MSPIHPLNFFLNFFFLQESSKCSNEGDYQSKVSQAQVLKTQPFLFVFMLPLGLFGVATVGSAVRGVKLLFWYGHYIYTWVCFKIDNLPTNIQFHSSGWLCIISGDWMQEESEGKKLKKHTWPRCLLSMLPLCDINQQFSMSVAFGCCSWAITFRYWCLHLSCSLG